MIADSPAVSLHLSAATSTVVVRKRHISSHEGRNRGGAIWSHERRRIVVVIKIGCNV